MNPCMFMIVPSPTYSRSQSPRGNEVVQSPLTLLPPVHLRFQSSIPMKNRLEQEKIPDDTADQLPGRHASPMGFTFQGSCLAAGQKHGQFHHFLVKSPQALSIQTRNQPPFSSFHGELPTQAADSFRIAAVSPCSHCSFTPRGTVTFSRLTAQNFSSGCLATRPIAL